MYYSGAMPASLSLSLYIYIYYTHRRPHSKTRSFGGGGGRGGDRTRARTRVGAPHPPPPHSPQPVFVSVRRCRNVCMCVRACLLLYNNRGTPLSRRGVNRQARRVQEDGQAAARAEASAAHQQALSFVPEQNRRPELIANLSLWKCPALGQPECLCVRACVCVCVCVCTRLRVVMLAYQISHIWRRGSSIHTHTHMVTQYIYL